MGVTPARAEPHTLAHARQRRVVAHLIPKELEKGFGFLQSKPATAFSPVAVTPDELGSHWRDGKVHLPLNVELNGEHFGAPNAGVDMTFSFPAADRACGGDARARGWVDHRFGHDLQFGSRGGLGVSRRTADAGDDRARRAQDGVPALGDRVRNGDETADGQSIFGAIDRRSRATRDEMKLYTYSIPRRLSRAHRDELKGITPDYSFVSLIKDGGEQHKPEYRAVNPQELGADARRRRASDRPIAGDHRVSRRNLSDAAAAAVLSVGKGTRAAARAGVACDMHPINNLSVRQYLKSGMNIPTKRIGQWYEHFIHRGFKPIEGC